MIPANWVKNQTLLSHLRLIYDIKKQYGMDFVAILDPNALINHLWTVMNCMQNNDMVTIEKLRFDLPFKIANTETAQKIFAETIKERYPNAVESGTRDSTSPGKSRGGRASRYAQCNHTRVVHLFPDPEDHSISEFLNDQIHEKFHPA